MIVTRILLWALVTFHLEQCLAVRHHVMPERNGALISAVSACDRLNKKQCRNYQKRKDVPAGYKCAWMKNCYKGLIFVKGPFKHTADCGILGLRAQGVCIGIVESPMHLASPPSDHDEEVEEGPPTAASDDLDDDALYGIDDDDDETFETDDDDTNEEDTEDTEENMTAPIGIKQEYWA
mmetsp:Transcript_1344/g.1590  ORF Transcript_1344/g.1590 Transcript_1344/m.1590 type:complete len:179 (-) Transcript_1344:56-592(-)